MTGLGLRSRRLRARVRAARTGAGEDGTAIIEFVLLGGLMLLPLVYVIVALSRVQAAGYAVEGSARAAARAMVVAPSEEQGRRAAAVAVRLGLADQGFQAEDPGSSLTMSCSASPCLTPQARVSATVSVEVVLPGIPGFVDRLVPLRSRITATQVAVVDRFRATQQAAP
ncbi:MAG: pilus assembly protein [Kineosporiaceae bacterium]